MTKLFSILTAAAVAAALAAPALAANKTVLVKDDFFQAKIVTINKGNTVTWKWVGESPHNVRFKSVGSALKVNGFYKRTFRTRGTFRYRCTIHSGMTGKVIVQ